MSGSDRAVKKGHQEGVGARGGGAERCLDLVVGEACPRSGPGSGLLCEKGACLGALEAHVKACE